jgi:hypothetical protein
MPRGWRQLGLWIPLGYTATRFAGHDRSVLVLIASIVLLVGLHRFIPGAVELFAGGGGLLVILVDVIDGRGAGAGLGDVAIAAVVVFTSVMWVSGFVRLLASANSRDMARHLIVAAVALDLSLLALRPMRHTVLSAQDDMSQAAALLVILFATTVVALRARIGVPLLGIGLVMAQGLLALTGASAALSPVTALVGTAAFAGMVLVLDGRRAVHPVELRPTRPTVQAA